MHIQKYSEPSEYLHYKRTTAWIIANLSQNLVLKVQIAKHPQAPKMIHM